MPRDRQKGRTAMEGNELKSKELVEALLLGSAEIDRMKKEVNFLIRMVVGLIDNGQIRKSFVNKRPPSGEGPSERRYEVELGSLSSSSGKCDWSITFLEEEDASGDKKLNWVATCWVNDVLVYQVGNGDYCGCFKLGDLHSVHGGIWLFINGITKKFPSVLNRMQPFLDAAAAAKKRNQS